MTQAITVVVADDHPLFREGVVRTISEQSDMLVVGEAADAESAIGMVAKAKPQIVLIDISMPGNGIVAVQEISALNSGAKAIMLTVSENDDDIMDALKAGAQGYVLKGIGGDELLSVIRAVNDGHSYVSPSLAARMLIAMKDPQPEYPTTDQLMASLTPRELQILELISHGMSNKEVGRELGLQEKTVKHYMTNILQKLQARNRVEAAVKAREAWRAADRKQ